MNVCEYFNDTVKGMGVLATADGSGKVNLAVYAKPHIVDAETIAFIMLDRLTHHNLQSNPHAAYLFREEGTGYKGRRLHLTKIKEEEDQETIESIRKNKNRRPKGKEFLVYFRVDNVLPLIGSGDK